MSLRFERKAAEGRLARGLAPGTVETFHYAYAGEVEFGYFFCVPCSRGEVWRWALLLAAPETSGEAETALDARQRLETCYHEMLLLAGLVERTG